MHAARSDYSFSLGLYNKEPWNLNQIQSNAPFVRKQKNDRQRTIEEFPTCFEAGKERRIWIYP